MKKLVIAVIQNEVADSVVDALLEADFRTTRLASTGGFLRRGNTTLMIGADENQVDYVLDLIRQRPAQEWLRLIGRGHSASCRDRVRPRSRGIPAPVAPSIPGTIQEQRTTLPRSSAWYSICSPETST